MENSIRVTALDYARSLPGVSSPEDLLRAANKIEEYIRAGNTVPASGGKIDFDAKHRENLSPHEFNWSGHAVELIKACNSNDVLVLKPRQTGFSRLMAEYFAHHSRQHGKSVLWMEPTRSQADHNLRMLADLGADMSLIKCTTYQSVIDGYGQRGRGYDFVFGNELASLSFANDNAFLAAIMPLGSRFIFGTTPNLPRGVFFDLWENSLSFQKLRLTWDTPLHEVTMSHLAQKEPLSRSVEQRVFRQQYMAEFADEPKQSPPPMQNHWPTAATTGGPWVTLNTTGAAAVDFSTPQTVATAPTGAYYSGGPAFNDQTIEPKQAKSKKPRRKGASFNDGDYTDPVT